MAYVRALVTMSPPEKPVFSARNLALDVVHGAHALFVDPFVNRIIIPIICTLSSAACKLIIRTVPYTEIDFKTYMQQIELVNDGEIDYSLIVGDTGPMVYPAGFVQVHQALYWLTDLGSDITTAQVVFSFLFVLSVLLSCIVYTMVPGLQPWPLYLFLLSKRLYSIHVLRLFNDCFTTVAMVAVVLLLQQASYWYSTMGSFFTYLLVLVAADLYSLAISVKMNALLYLPGFLLVSYFLVEENLLKFLGVVAVIPFIQVMVGWKFLLPLFHDEEAAYIRSQYLSQAFNFSRQFLFKWTVNWRFVGEELFLSKNFQTSLLVGHVSVLLLFVFTRYLSRNITQKLIKQLLVDAIARPFSSTIHSSNKFLSYHHGPKLILLVMATTNVIGVLFSRSLHYQFLSWYCWQLPFLLYATGVHFVFGFAAFAIHEWCWNVYPSTPSSSAVLVGSLCLVLIGVWSNKAIWFDDEQPDQQEHSVQPETKKTI